MAARRPPPHRHSPSPPPCSPLGGRPAPAATPSTRPWTASRPPTPSPTASPTSSRPSRTPPTTRRRPTKPSTTIDKNLDKIGDKTDNADVNKAVDDLETGRRQRPHVHRERRRHPRHQPGHGRGGRTDEGLHPVEPAGGLDTGRMTRLILATRNAGKITELKAILADAGLPTTSSARTPTPTSPTSRKPASPSPRTPSSRPTPWPRPPACPAVADDSGLCVDVLGGAPGIFSARWAGTPRRRPAPTCDLLLAQLGDIDATRTAAPTSPARRPWPSPTARNAWSRATSAAPCATPRPARTASATTRSSSRTARPAPARNSPPRRRTRSATGARRSGRWCRWCGSCWAEDRAIRERPAHRVSRFAGRSCVRRKGFEPSSRFHGPQILSLLRRHCATAASRLSCVPGGLSSVTSPEGAACGVVPPAAPGTGDRVAVGAQKSEVLRAGRRSSRR